MKKIVLIEDDADLFSLLKYNLEKEGFAVAGTQTGRGAIELCRRDCLFFSRLFLCSEASVELLRLLDRHRARPKRPMLDGPNGWFRRTESNPLKRGWSLNPRGILARLRVNACRDVTARLGWPNRRRFR